MIAFDEALKQVLNQSQSYGSEVVHLASAQGKILAESIVADRDFPPFDRATKDGIAIRFETWNSSQSPLKSIGIAQAGSPQLELRPGTNCIEVMTGAMVPKNADTVVMYEHTTQRNGHFSIEKPIDVGQNIHYQASDVPENHDLLFPGTLIGPAEIGVLSTVGRAKVRVKKLPSVAVITTGNELVDVDQIPKPYQIRKSNSHTLVALLQNRGVVAEAFHLKDDQSAIEEQLQKLLSKYDLLLLSGGVSKGKFDFLPNAFNELGVEKIFHRVRQRPGKPFWFGKHKRTNTLVFSFPGNPVSTYVNYHLYFIPWLNKSLGRYTKEYTVLLEENMENKTELTIFKGVELRLAKGTLYASSIPTTGSGDLLNPSKADGFVRLAPEQDYAVGDPVQFIQTKSIL